MDVAYKCLMAGKDIMLVFESVKNVPKGNVFLAHSIVDGKQYLRLGEELYVPLDDIVMDKLKGAENILLGESGLTDFEIRFVGRVSVEPLSLGRLLAYYEMN